MFFHGRARALTQTQMSVSGEPWRRLSTDIHRPTWRKWRGSARRNGRRFPQIEVWNSCWVIPVTTRACIDSKRCFLILSKRFEYLLPCDICVYVLINLQKNSTGLVVFWQFWVLCVPEWGKMNLIFTNGCNRTVKLLRGFEYSILIQARRQAYRPGLSESRPQGTWAGWVFWKVEVLQKADFHLRGPKSWPLRTGLTVLLIDLDWLELRGVSVEELSL